MSRSTINIFESLYLRNGSCVLSDLLKEFSSFGVKALALCNYGNLIGAISFFKNAKDFGIKPIIGMQVKIASDIEIFCIQHKSTGFVYSKWKPLFEQEFKKVKKGANL